MTTACGDHQLWCGLTKEGCCDSGYFSRQQGAQGLQVRNKGQRATNKGQRSSSYKEQSLFTNINGNLNSRSKNQKLMQIPTYIPKKNENICPHKNLYTHVPNSIISNSPKGKTNQMFINGLVNKQKKWYIHTMEYYLATKRTTHWYTLQHGWILNTSRWVKEARHKIPTITWFHLCEMSRLGNGYGTLWIY